MQSIETVYLPPTNMRGARIRVKASGRKDSVTVAWNHAFDVEPNHAGALSVAVRRWGAGWTRYHWVGGDSKRGMVWVCNAPTAPHVNA